MESKKVVFSGMRPTGPLHLGHLVGALSNWNKLQDESDCLFMIADWHALMSEYKNPANIRDYCVDIAQDWLSVGIDPNRCVIFVQSSVVGHLELNMILSVLTPLSWLERNPTYKEQLRELTQRELTTYGFLGYPVLQTADILLYKAGYVPIGMDQLPHLEIARELTRRFHFIFNKQIFPEPQAIISQTPKLLGLDNRKMSKSYENYISLRDSEDDVRGKISIMITDPQRLRKTDQGHPDVCNVFSYFKVFANDECENVRDYCQGAKIGCTECKKNLADKVIEILKPIQSRRKDFSKSKVMEIISEGNKRANEISKNTMKEVREVAGLLS